MYVQGTFLHSMRVDGLKALGHYISAQPYGRYTGPGGAVIDVDPTGLQLCSPYAERDLHLHSRHFRT